MHEPSRAALEFDSVCFAYGNASKLARSGGDILSNTTFRVREGELVALMGRNGSGKSSIAKLSNALLRPRSGRVSVFGRSLQLGDDAYDIRKLVGLVFQNPSDSIVSTIVEDEVAFGLENLGVPPAEIRLRICEALREVGAEGYQSRDVSTLSGGQRQRVCIAAVLAMRPRLLIMDECTSMLDPSSSEEVWDAVEAARNANATILFITQRYDEALRADRILMMEEGHAIEVPKERVQAMQSAEVDSILRIGSSEGASSSSPVNAGSTFLPDMPASSQGTQGHAAPSLDSNEASFVPSLELKGVSFRYPDAQEDVLSNFSLTVSPGDFLAVVGPNGSGKSTLLSLSCGLLAPTQGVVEIAGQETSSKQERNAARHHVGLCMQDPERAIFSDTVFKEVAFGLESIGASRSQMEEGVRFALSLVGFDAEKVRDLNPRHLSGGEARRVAIAAAIATKPSVLALDEPFANLDSESKVHILRCLAQLAGRGFAILLVTHDKLIAQYVCSGMVRLDRPGSDAR